MEGRFYWLKLHRDFFKRHDIKVVESMQNGKDYILFYLKLLVESVDHEGSLRFSDSIPYSAEMLSAVTNTNVDVVKGAIKVFTELGMITILPDSTIYMEEVNKMIGSAANNDAANRKRRQREREKLEQAEVPMLECDTSVTFCHESKSKRESKSNKDIKHKHGEYQHVLLTETEFENLANTYGIEMRDKAITFLDEYIEMKGYKAKSHNLAIRKWVVNAVKEHEQRENRNQPKQNKFNQMIHTDYDFDEIEKQILGG